ncbi:MAG: hypothetical protein K0A93_03055 [Desulfuromonadaceae bacterium]|nr:hypothetical protein [Desulfuromonadaceae bacterium]
MEVETRSSRAINVEVGVRRNVEHRCDCNKQFHRHLIEHEGDAPRYPDAEQVVIVVAAAVVMIFCQLDTPPTPK